MEGLGEGGMEALVSSRLDEVMGCCEVQVVSGHVRTLE